MNRSEIRILVVDDDADLLNGTVRLLENAGYTVGRSATGEEALQAVRDRRSDLLLLDRDLPDVDGLEVCRRIKQEPAQADIFVVVISASYTKSEEQAEGLESGADGYIPRPISNRELLARVDAYVRILCLTRSLRLHAEGLKQSNEASDQAQLASLNLMEDAMAARERAEQASQSLRKSRDLIVKLTAQVPGMVFQYQLHADGHASIPFSSPGINDIYEVTPEAVREDATQLHRRHHPDDYDRIAAAIQESARTQRPFHCEFRVVLPRQGLRWRLCDSSPERMEDGSTLWHGIVSDITERKQAEESLRESTERLHMAQSAAHVGIWDHDFKTQRTVWTVEQEALFGFTPGTFDGAPLAFEQLVHPDDRPRMAQAIARALETGTFELEFRATRCDGALRWFTGHGQIYRDAAGQPERMIGINLDITERKQAEAERARLAMAVEQSAETIEITDASGTILYVNPAFEKTTGYTRAEALGQNPRILKSGQHDAEFYRQMWTVLDRGEIWTGRFSNRRKDGTLYEEDASISPVRDAVGKVVNYVAVKRDITREAQLEDQLRQSQKMDAIGQLSGGVAHDFNNILSAMIMQVELTGMAENLTEEVREGLRHICAGAERAANLTRQLLLFSRKQVMQPRELDLNDVVTSLAKMLQRIIGEDVGLQLNLHPRAQITRADPGMLDQVLMNLVVNARDAMPGGGRIVVETSEKNFTAEEAALIPDAKPGRHVSLRVSDTGCGIAPENLSRIFEPFFTTKAPGKGTGLGLATVFGIVKQHGGSLTVESEVGRGTTFQVFLPATESVGQSPAAAAAKPKPRGGTETILLVEDEAAVRILTRAVLERFGYRVLEAADGVEALRIWEQNQDAIRLLLTDLVMPEGVSGRELAVRLQARSPRLRVVFTSGYSADIAGRELSLQEGQNFIQKPSSSQQLLETVRRCLDS